ncbi:Peptidase OS=Streptomyces microflavus OX=1919 GN=Smic_69950 PE=3 SV=1 [Streptomyces microflavus]
MNDQNTERWSRRTELRRHGAGATRRLHPVQCRRRRLAPALGTWRNDTRRIHDKAPFMAWNNTWYNAPCADWPVAPLTPVRVNNDRLPATLILQATGDAATPSGAVAMHRKSRAPASWWRRAAATTASR